MRELNSREWQQALITFYTQNLNFWLLENLNGYETVEEAKAKAYADSIKVKNYPFSPNGAEVPEDVKLWFISWLDEIAGKEQKPGTDSKKLADLELRIDQLQQSILEAKAVIPFNKSDIEELIEKRVKEHEDDSCHPCEDDLRSAAEDILRDWDACCVSDIEDKIRDAVDNINIRSTVDDAIDDIDFESRINDAFDNLDFEGRVKSVLRDITSDF